MTDITETIKALTYPFDTNYISRKKKAIKRELTDELQKRRLCGENIVSTKIAILGGSTTSEIKDVLELFLLKHSIEPLFYESEYNKYFEDIVFDNNVLMSFAPNIIYIHTTYRNITNLPEISDSADTVENKFRSEIERYKSLWQKAQETYRCIVIQNNFDYPPDRALGNLDCSNIHGTTHFIGRLNAAFADYAAAAKNFYINDINYLSASLGLNLWHDRAIWYAYKYALSYKAVPHLCHNAAAIIAAIYGKNKKCLVVDLDNTLWGGVIAEESIKIGTGDPQAEAFTEFQQYLRKLKSRGVLLAVCSKNDEHIALEGLNHRDSTLHPDDFVSIKANWQNKDVNIAEIAKELNIMQDSMVFLDDNPVERSIVASQLPAVEVPEALMSDVTGFIETIDRSCYFEVVTISEDDIKRSGFYRQTQSSQSLQSKFASYEEFLTSLEMTAEIAPISQSSHDRVVQLINKTNQFNLTTKRYTSAEVESISSKDSSYITLCGRLRDKFGDNGLVSVIIASVKDGGLFIDLWLMSCRVLKRNMEFAMFDALVEECKVRGIKHITGYYYRTNKNDMVSNHYELMGFERKDDAGTTWSFVIDDNYRRKNSIITTRERALPSPLNPLP
ncbi:HAD-IIIC family phosphatase [Candidatus Magnetomonas plexicatena]|uniref:HAD-IIIC family phosphatase n=1 Tax=Candidatus Magnetomonas plexicatena TaxID=2552947 RepID=UPI001100B18D|nr:HAD-IIIC family phosphatase [Nitrospirales bacterium LBB_01]